MDNRGHSTCSVTQEPGDVSSLSTQSEPLDRDVRSHSGNDDEIGRRKMLVKAKGFLNLLSSHHHEAHRVRIAEILITVLPQNPFGFFLDVFARIGFPDSGAGLQSLEKTQGC